MIQPKETWTRDFCLLANSEQNKTPTQESLLHLKEAGLGQERIVFKRLLGQPRPANAKREMQ